jgi:hypothetical protein
MLSPLARDRVAPQPALSNVEEDHPMELDRRDFLKLGGALTQHLGQTTTQIFPISPGDTLKF